MYLIFDTETTGLPLDWKAPLTNFENWPRCVQLAWQMHDKKGKLIDAKRTILSNLMVIIFLLMLKKFMVYQLKGLIIKE